MDNLRNKVVLITGASIGIGRETAYRFAKEKCRLVITYYKDKKEAFEVQKKCLGLGANDVLVLQLNVMDNKSIKNCVKKAIDKFKEISILINNAGIVAWKELKDQTYQDIEDQIRTNLEGLIKVTKECLPYIKDAIINISSSAGKHGYKDITTYCATKFGVRGFSQALAHELRKTRIYNVNPGTTATRMTDFTGVSPDKVAQVILDTAKGKYKVDATLDIDVWKILNSEV